LTERERATLQERVERQDLARASEHQWAQREEEDNVCAGVIGAGVEADGQEEPEGKGHPAEGGNACQQT
jgi:hypothetical protein